MKIKTDIKTKFFSEGYRNGLKREAHHPGFSDVEIDIENVRVMDGENELIAINRPVAARGVVWPMDQKIPPTFGSRRPRKKPDPLAYESLELFVEPSIPRKAMNRILPSHSRGHVFALGLGGPNVRENIIPQWTEFQASGDWARFEKQVANDAFYHLNRKIPGSSLFLEVGIDYLNLQSEDLQHKLSKVFDFRKPEDFSEERVIDALRLLGSPVKYLCHTCPCSTFLKKPEGHSLSIAYIKALYEVSKELYKNRSNLEQPYPDMKEAKKLLAAAGWDVEKLSKDDLLPGHPELLSGAGDKLVRDEGFFLPRTIERLSLTRLFSQMSTDSSSSSLSLSSLEESLLSPTESKPPEGWIKKQPTSTAISDSSTMASSGDTKPLHMSKKGSFSSSVGADSGVERGFESSYEDSSRSSTPLHMSKKGSFSSSVGADSGVERGFESSYEDSSRSSTPLHMSRKGSFSSSASIESGGTVKRDFDSSSSTESLSDSKSPRPLEDSPVNKYSKEKHRRSFTNILKKSSSDLEDKQTLEEKHKQSFVAKSKQDGSSFGHKK